MSLESNCFDNKKLYKYFIEFDNLLSPSKTSERITEDRFRPYSEKYETFNRVRDLDALNPVNKELKSTMNIANNNDIKILSSEKSKKYLSNRRESNYYTLSSSNKDQEKD